MKYILRSVVSVIEEISMLLTCLGSKWSSVKQDGQHGYIYIYSRNNSTRFPNNFKS